jgi:hypothetical protein
MAVPPARHNRYSVLATSQAKITSANSTPQAELHAPPHNPSTLPSNPDRGRQTRPRLPQHRRACNHGHSARPSMASTARGRTPSIPLAPEAPAGTPPLRPAPSHSPQPRNLRPFQRPPPRALEPLHDEWERTLELHLSRIQEAPDTDTKVEDIRTLHHLPSICLTVSPSKGKHRRILARLQTAQSEGPHPEAPEPVASGSQRARPHNRRPAQPSERTLVARTHSHLQYGNVSRAASCLQALPLATVTSEVMQQFAALHPYECPPRIPSTDMPPFCITAKRLSAVLTRLRRGTAPGLTDWTYECILDATRRPSARQACIHASTSRSVSHESASRRFSRQRKSILRRHVRIPAA